MRLGYWLKISLPIFLVESFFFLLTNADVLMVGFYMEPDQVAVYFATVKTLALVHFVYFAVKAGVAQRYAQFSHGDPERLASFARETVSWTFWPSLAMGLMVLVARQAAADPVRPRVRRRLSAAVPAGRRRWWRAPPSAPAKAC